jgi:pyridoxine 5-phosphate synthase
VPHVLEAVDTCVAAGAPGITVHPRADRRHITPDDVRAIAAFVRKTAPQVEYNIEGDPRPELLELVHEVRPDQCTLVPVVAGEITSQVGWQAGSSTARLPDVIGALKSHNVRVSVFVDAQPDAIHWAAAVGADRIELFTEPFARAFQQDSGVAHRAFTHYAEMAGLAHRLGLGVNAGHDLDLDNLCIFRGLPFLDEVSIGHALISRALFVGLSAAVREYLGVLASGA